MQHWSTAVSKFNIYLNWPRLNSLAQNSDIRVKKNSVYHQIFSFLAPRKFVPSIEY